MNKLMRGFSLIELMVVIAILAILSAVAIPAYNEYVQKARVIELIAVADAYKTKVADAISAGSTPSIDTVTNPTDYVSQLEYVNLSGKHAIVATGNLTNLKVAASGGAAFIIQLVGEEKGEILKWSCHVAQEYKHLTPSSCQNALQT